MLNEVISELEESSRIKRLVAESMAEKVVAAAEMILAAYRSGGKVVLFGNGGSAADAQHIAGELVGRFQKERPALAAIALTTDTSVLTALGNDYGYETVFARQVEALVGPKDVVVAISTSGNSPNVLQGVRVAKERGAATVGMTGGNGGELAQRVDLALVVPSYTAPRIQEAHITIGHILCGLVERELFPER